MVVSERPIRPTRPRAERPTALAKKFTGQPARLAVRVDKATLRGLRRAAANADKTVKRFVLDALQEKGVEIAAIDLTDDGEE
jgi:hypothetical protein